MTYRVLIILLMGFPLFVFADSATCKIEINDVVSMNKYYLEYKYQFDKGGAGHFEVFELPGTDDYLCWLAFYDLNTGTMISCEYKKDDGHTFFQSDRSGLEENDENRLTFRHGSVFMDVKSSCK